MQTERAMRISSTEKTQKQEPFTRVAPILGAALLLGAGGGFALATVLTLMPLMQVSLGSWWSALAQAHGHLQLYGWAGLFVLGVSLHFLPRLRGTPLVVPKLVPWILGVLVTGLLLRATSQPLFVATGVPIWGALLVASGAAECVALLGAVCLLGMTLWRGPLFSPHSTILSVLPFIVGGLSTFGLASVVNLINMVLAITAAGLVPASGDDLNVTLGLFGFLVPIALAMSAQSLPMYAGLEAFPRRLLWPLAGLYFTGLVLLSVGIWSRSQQAVWPGMLEGLGMLLIGIVLLIFIGVFMRIMRLRGKLPKRVAQLAPSTEVAARAYHRRIGAERSTFGPFVVLVASAYLWAMFGGVLLIVDGVTMLIGWATFFAIDALRHSLAIGFIALLICGIAPRMIPGFSGGNIASPGFVHATLWLGNIAVLLRVGSLLLAPVLITATFAEVSLYSIFFGLSGPIGLGLALCLAVNLWPALWPTRSARA